MKFAVYKTLSTINQTLLNKRCFVVKDTPYIPCTWFQSEPYLCLINISTNLTKKIFTTLSILFTVAHVRSGRGTCYRVGCRDPTASLAVYCQHWAHCSHCVLVHRGRNEHRAGTSSPLHHAVYTDIGPDNCDITVWQYDWVTIWLYDYGTTWLCCLMTVWQHDCVMIWLCDKILCYLMTVWQYDHVTIWPCNNMTV